MNLNELRPKAIIYGCEGLEITDVERDFFSTVKPLGFILFERNCKSPAQVVNLINELRAVVGCKSLLVLIDQEGGRVARLKGPVWKTFPKPRRLGEIYLKDSDAGIKAARLNGRLIAAELSPLGINVNCAPVLDIPVSGAHTVIGDRAFGSLPKVVAELGLAMCEGLISGGVCPVIKHLPGHGRARTDSHLELPIIRAAFDELLESDFRPFQKLAYMPMGMLAHVVLFSLDARRSCTTSPIIINDIIRGIIGFKGLLLSDDICMAALSGGIGERCNEVLEAGCDIALHCSGIMEEMILIADNVGELTDAAMERLIRVYDIPAASETFDKVTAQAELDELLERV